MGNIRIKPSKSFQIKDQAVINGINSKYTYKQICNFNEVIINSFGNYDLSGLSRDELLDLQNFIELMVRIWDTPEKTFRLNHRSKNIMDYSDKPILSKSRQKATIKGTKPDKFLHAILKWIFYILSMNEITLLKILDEFFKSFPKMNK